MKAATWPRTRRTEAKLLDVDVRRGTIDDRRADDLPDLLTAGDLLVVNDAATLPASLSGRVEAGGDTVELRLLAAAATRLRALESSAETTTSMFCSPR